MDTIQNVMSSASNIIFGNSTEQSGSEPVSGQTGAGTVGDPYDQGNADGSDGSPPQDRTPSAFKTTPTNPTDATSNKMSFQPTTEDPSGQQPVQKQEGDDRPTESPTQPAENQAVQEIKRDAETTQQADTINNNDQQQQDPSSQEIKRGAETTQQADTISNNDQQQQDPSSQEINRDDETTQQAGTINNNDQQQQDPSSGDKDVIKQVAGEGKHPRTEEERQELATTDQLPKIPGDRSGEPLRMHGGGDEDADPSTRLEEEGSKPDLSASDGQEGGGEHGKEKGTGSKYVKSTGMAADGGDFDATRPGAGREAIRLMEEKGLHKSERGDDAPGAGKQPPVPSEPSKIDKLKEKLHIGTGKHGNEQAV